MSRKTTSAGLLLFRIRDDRLELFIAHMGGPFWAKKDDGGWSIPKGEYDDAEDAFAAACREFEEETGSAAPAGPSIELGTVRQPSGKRIVAWAIEGDIDPATVCSNTFVMEWPPRSGRQREFPEIDRAAWVDPDTARRKLVKGQVPFVEILERQLAAAGRTLGAPASSRAPAGAHVSDTAPSPCRSGDRPGSGGTPS